MTDYAEGDRVSVRLWNGYKWGTVIRHRPDDGYLVRLDGATKARTVQADAIRPRRDPPPVQALTRPVVERAPEVTPIPKVLPVRDRGYLAWLRTLPCAFCGRHGSSEASHHGRHGMSSKASDLDAVPACGANSTWVGAEGGRDMREGCHARWHRMGSPAPWLDHMTPDEKRDVFAFFAGLYRAKHERETT